MSFRIGHVALLIICLFGCDYSPQANEVTPLKIKYVIKGAEDRGEEYVGNVARLYIHSDLARDDDDVHSAFIKMDDINGEVPLISLVKVYIYRKKCTGTSDNVLYYAEVSYEKAVLPQVFGTSQQACVEIELYVWTDIEKPPEERGLELVDIFQVEIMKH